MVNPLEFLRSRRKKAADEEAAEVAEGAAATEAGATPEASTEASESAPAGEPVVEPAPAVPPEDVKPPEPEVLERLTPQPPDDTSDASDEATPAPETSTESAEPTPPPVAATPAADATPVPKPPAAAPEATPAPTPPAEEPESTADPATESPASGDDAAPTPVPETSASPPDGDPTAVPGAPAPPVPPTPAVDAAGAPSTPPPPAAEAPPAAPQKVAPPAPPEEPLPPPMSAEEARETYGQAVKAVGEFFKAAKVLAKGRKGELPIADIEAVAASLVRAMAHDHTGDLLVALAVGAYPEDVRFVVPHSANVAVLSQRVARQLGIRGDELQTLTVAALVHDVGTVRIPKEVFYKGDSLSNEEWEMMRQRPALGAEIIRLLGPRYAPVAEIAHQVHERLDGNGYPRALQVDTIALEASILGAVDIFEAFIHPRPYKKTVPAAAMYGVDNLMRMSHQFGDGVLKALVRSVGLFPVGTYVRLNSGEVARVLKGRSANPMRPEVEVVFDTQKRRLGEPRFIDLMATPHLYVFKPLSPEDMAEYRIR